MYIYKNYELEHYEIEYIRICNMKLNMNMWIWNYTIYIKLWTRTLWNWIYEYAIYEIIWICEYEIIEFTYNYEYIYKWIHTCTYNMYISLWINYKIIFTF